MDTFISQIHCFLLLFILATELMLFRCHFPRNHTLYSPYASEIAGDKSTILLRIEYKIKKKNNNNKYL